jgi:hypothetical protein
MMLFRRKTTGSEPMLGGWRRGALVCAAGAVMLVAGWSLSMARPVKAQRVASVCTNEAYAYFEAATEQEFELADDEPDNDVDGAGEALTRCLDDALQSSDPRH